MTRRLFRAGEGVLEQIPMRHGSLALGEIGRNGARLTIVEAGGQPSVLPLAAWIWGADAGPWEVDDRRRPEARRLGRLHRVRKVHTRPPVPES